ncbi:MAG: uridine kinase [Bacteroidales bacterium]|nr:uridine kinase [Bacteroidales bacterium]
MLIIGIAGGSGSGKTTVVKKITGYFSNCDVAVISQDSYYKDLSYLSFQERKKMNFDHPSAIEFSLLEEHLKQLKSGKAIEMPEYSYVTSTRSSTTITIAPSKVVILEGILIYTYKVIRDLLDIRIFVDADPDDRLMRIIRRDVNQRGRSYDQALKHYERFVKPMHQQFIEPNKRYADIIVPQGGENRVAIDLIVSRIKHILSE